MFRLDGKIAAVTGAGSGIGREIANTFTVYPSLSGSIAEVARQLHTRKLASDS